ncbi:hypothetical protein FBU59_001358 [Linderina macrospora]|uniref:Uncharacterized protein n=1 Tax=Linderina macrospora TaxID=4868 RepID=A0ACC1JE79_9FUNG|nr:hypothetical protein FBU59_001358 [Linderina macrospora]
MPAFQEAIDRLAPQQPVDTLNEFEAELRGSSGRTNGDSSIGSNVFDDDGDDDDPANIAMVLEDADEAELKSIVPGTPMAWEKLEQLTKKSITRQRTRQTPARPYGTGSLLERSSQRNEVVSPSKRGKENNLASLMSSIVLITTPPATSRSRGAQAVVEKEYETESILRIRSSHHAIGVLNKIKGIPTSAVAASSSSIRRPSRNPIFITGTPILLGKSDESDTNESIEDDYEKPLPPAIYMRTPKIPRKEHIARIDNLRQFFFKDRVPEPMPTASVEERIRTSTLENMDANELLISFESVSQQQDTEGSRNMDDVTHSAAGSERQVRKSTAMVHSPTPLYTANQATEGFNPDIAQPTNSTEVKSSQVEQNARAADVRADENRSNDLASTACSGLQGTLQQANPIDLDASIAAIDRAEQTLNRSVANLTTLSVITNDGNSQAHVLAAKELEGQIQALRQMMEETKSLVSAIQHEVSQHRPAAPPPPDESKLDNIVDLLNGLDLRLDQLETSKARPTPVTLRSPTTVEPAKVDILEKPRQLLQAAGLVGHNILDYIAENPLVIVGILLAILLSELFVLSGSYTVLMYRLRFAGRYAFEGMRQHVILPPPPS